MSIPKVKDEQKTELRIPVECYTRIVGYLRPVDAYNPGKRQEYEERVNFNTQKALNADPATQA